MKYEQYDWGRRKPPIPEWYEVIHRISDIAIADAEDEATMCPAVTELGAMIGALYRQLGMDTEEGESGAHPHDQA